MVNCYAAAIDELTTTTRLIVKLKIQIKKGKDTGILKIISADGKPPTFKALGSKSTSDLPQALSQKTKILVGTPHPDVAGVMEVNVFNGRAKCTIPALTPMPSNEKINTDEVINECFESTNTKKFYVADVEFSWLSDTGPGLNNAHLGRFWTENDFIPKIPGVHTAYSYRGVKNNGARFHIEDGDLVSVNYLKEGYPKLWISFSRADNNKFINCCRRLYPRYFKKCPHFYRHKTIWIKPSVLKRWNITPYVTIQHPNDIIVTLEQEFHAVINLGPSLAEAQNVGSAEWVDLGIFASRCQIGWKNS